jgi:hypothetical protein
MGLPEILIEFQTKAVTAIQRSEKGIVALILKDDTGTFDTKEYKSIDEVLSTDWTVTNKDYIDKTFMGTPSKVIVERIATTAIDYNEALTRLKNKKWNYLAIPGIESTNVTNVASWIVGMRTNEKKTFKAVLPNSPTDNEGVINFTTEGIKVGDTTYSASQYTCRIAGILAGLPFTRSCTYYVLPEVESITDHEDPDADIDAGQLILINDGEKVKIARGVNSFVTTTVTKGEPFKKIKIVEGMDLMMDDIRDTFNNSYVGKVINNYDNKILFLSAVNAYLKTLAKDDILDINYNNLAEIDVEAQRLYLQSIGTNIEEMEEQEIKEANTGSKVFITSNVRFVDAMEDLTFVVNL